MGGEMRSAVGISCNPIWDGGVAPREILTDINMEKTAETGGNKKAASKQGRRKMLRNCKQTKNSWHWYCNCKLTIKQIKH